MIVRLNPAVRIIPPSEVIGARWVAENLLEKRRYNVSRAAAGALVAAARPREPGQLAEWLDRRHGQGHAPAWTTLVDSLRERRLLVDADTVDTDPDIAWLVALRRDWDRAGWREAAEYHALTFDYPCLDYTEALGTLTDQSRMRAYQAQEPDRDRFKTDYLDRPETPLPAPRADLVDTSARQLWTDPPTGGKVTADVLTAMASLTFGRTGTRIPVTDSAPLLRRSSPSGGGRHPSEGYLIVLDAAGVEPGWYHVTIEPFGLRRLDRPAPEDAEFTRLFPATARRFPDRPAALFLLTTVFERNMYRYREPRTFRTVHMDAGHLAGTLRLTGRSLGVAAEVVTGDAALDIEKALGINGMREGYLLTVAVADGGESA